MKAELPKLITAIVLAIIVICVVISTVALLQIRADMKRLYNVTAKPHCYLSPNDPRRREIEKQWGSEPTSEGTCDKEGVQ